MAGSLKHYKTIQTNSYEDIQEIIQDFDFDKPIKKYSSDPYQIVLSSRKRYFYKLWGTPLNDAVMIRPDFIIYFHGKFDIPLDVHKQLINSVFSTAIYTYIITYEYIDPRCIKVHEFTSLEDLKQWIIHKQGS